MAPAIGLIISTEILLAKMLVGSTIFLGGIVMRADTLRFKIGETKEALRIHGIETCIAQDKSPHLAFKKTQDIFYQDQPSPAGTCNLQRFDEAYFKVPKATKLIKPKQRSDTPKFVSSEFAKLAKKVETVEGRLEELENPPPVVLDKPRLDRGCKQTRGFKT